MNDIITMKLNADPLILSALKEDITSQCLPRRGRFDL